MGADDSLGRPTNLREPHTHPEPPGHSEDHLRVILRRELPLSEGKRRPGGEDSVSESSVATTASRMAGCCCAASPLGRSRRTTTAVNWTDLAVPPPEVTRRDVTGGRPRVSPTWRLSRGIWRNLPRVPTHLAGVSSPWRPKRSVSKQRDHANVVRVSPRTHERAYACRIRPRVFGICVVDLLRKFPHCHSGMRVYGSRRFLSSISISHI